MSPYLLHLGKYYHPHPGGMEIYLRQLVLHQSKVMKLDVIVANDFRRTRIEFLDGAKVTRVGRLGVIASMPVTPMMTSYIRQCNPNLIHLHMPNPGAAFALLTSGYSGKLIITHHADTLGREHLRRLTDPIVRKVMERSSAIIVTSNRYLETSEELATFRLKCQVIPLGIDPSSFEHTNVAAIREIRAKYGERLVLAVGRLVPYKGFEYLIQSMKRVNGRLLLIGTGLLHRDLQRRIESSGIQDKTVMLGHVDDIAPYYKAASVFVMPSVTRAEAFGVVQMEAMAAGIPVINTEIPSGVPEVSVHERTGLTVPPKDPEALANAINRLLDDEGLRQQFGKAAHERIRDGFSVEKMVTDTTNLYNFAM